jgi:hypothetical protein
MGATSMPSPQAGFGQPAQQAMQNPMDGQFDPTTGQPYAVSNAQQPAPGLPSAGRGGGKSTGPINTLAPGGGGQDFNGNPFGSDFGGQFNFGGAAPQQGFGMPAQNYGQAPMQTQAMTGQPAQNLKPGPGGQAYRTAGAAGMPGTQQPQFQSMNARPGTQMTANNVQRQQNNAFGNVRGQTAYATPTNRFIPPNAPGVRAQLNNRSAPTAGIQLPGTRR